MTIYKDASTDGWKPVENFSGVFEGRGYKISNLTISRSSERYVGLFGSVTGEAILSDVVLENVNVNGGKLQHSSNWGSMERGKTISRMDGICQKIPAMSPLFLKQNQNQQIFKRTLGRTKSLQTFKLPLKNIVRLLVFYIMGQI